MMSEAMKEIIILAVTLNDVSIEVQYLETRDQADKAGLVKSLVVERSLVEPLVQEIVENLEELIDKGLLAIRNPDPVLDPRKRLKKSAPVEEEVEDEGQ